MKDYSQKIGQIFFACLQGFKEFESKPRDYGTGDLLYGSEIHTLQMIGHQGSCNQNDLCRLLDISKSGISKFTGKLLDKGLISKERNGENRKEVILKLTEKGRIAYLAHESFDEKMFSSLYDLLEQFNEEERKTIELMLEGLRNKIQDLNKL
ncbi:MAG: MarR family transcriptional regulator [Spirochaetales bacterium]|nr:MarR family transcriptional regulator [Spirochaetales bacterium]